MKRQSNLCLTNFMVRTNRCLQFTNVLIFNLKIFAIIFTDNAYEYLTMWTEEFVFFQQFLWISLKKFPEWTTVKNSFEIFSTKTSFDMETKSQEVFTQFGYIKNYVLC